jgi:ring-1,2-phenylacetyl-CoA epoxidase subunit PaaE
MSAFKFHSLKVASIDRIAEDAVCVTLEVPAALREEFLFHAGQYVTVRRMLEDREERRSYSIVCAPDSGMLKVGIRLQPGGRVSNELAATIKAGDALEIGTPAGRFKTAVHPERALRYVAFASGSGITPVLSMITHILQLEKSSRVTLVYGNRRMSSTMFLEEILGLKNRFLHRFAVHFVMSREPQETAWLNGRVDAQKVKELAGKLPEIESADEYLICGPGDMVADISAALKELNPNSAIRFERFTNQAARVVPGTTTAGQSSNVETAAVLANIVVTMDGRRREFAMYEGDHSVLDAAERAGLSLPFSCRAGICATCRARVTEGKVVMAHNIALEPWETEAGFVLCCQARPTTPTLKLTYDQK